MSTPHVFSGRSFILCCGIICIFCGLAACKSGLDDEIENNSSADGNIASLSADSSDTSHAAVSDESQASASDGGSSAGSVGSAASHAASDAASSASAISGGSGASGSSVSGGASSGGSSASNTSSSSASGSAASDAASSESAISGESGASGSSVSGSVGSVGSAASHAASDAASSASIISSGVSGASSSSASGNASSSGSSNTALSVSSSESSVSSALSAGAEISTAHLVMVYIPNGTFTIGSPPDEPNRQSNETQHSVTLTKDFLMGKYEVTQELYQAVMGSNPSSFLSNPAEGEVQERRPVEMVSWGEMLVFCNKLSMLEGLTPVYSIEGETDPAEWGSGDFDVNWNANGYRLPTEAEWEYACRAGTTTAYNTGASISDDTGWYSVNSGSKTHEVGKKPANAWGLYDMHGNVCERCWDRYEGYTAEASTDPKGPDYAYGDYRMVRGGSWYLVAQYVRSAGRDVDYKYGRNYYGFRVVRNN